MVNYHFWTQVFVLEITVYSREDGGAIVVSLSWCVCVFIVKAMKCVCACEGKRGGLN